MIRNWKLEFVWDLEFAIWNFEIQRFYSALCLFVLDLGRNGG
jgi:hypothetical protein